MTFLTQGSGFTLDSSFEDFHPKRFGLTYSPPTIVLEYIVPSTGKLYHHNMRLTRLQAKDNTGRWVDYLCRKHSMYLPPRKVDRQQLHAQADSCGKQSLPRVVHGTLGRIDEP